MVDKNMCIFFKAGFWMDWVRRYQRIKHLVPGPWGSMPFHPTISDLIQQSNHLSPGRMVKCQIHELRDGKIKASVSWNEGLRGENSELQNLFSWENNTVCSDALYLSICLPPIHLSIHPPIRLSIYLPIYICTLLSSSIYLQICQSIHPCIYLPTYYLPI